MELIIKQIGKFQNLPRSTVYKKSINQKWKYREVQDGCGKKTKYYEFLSLPEKEQVLVVRGCDYEVFKGIQGFHKSLSEGVKQALLYRALHFSSVEFIKNDLPEFEKNAGLNQNLVSDDRLEQEQMHKALIKADLIKLYDQAVGRCKYGGKLQAKKNFIKAYNSGLAYKDIYSVIGECSWKTVDKWRAILRDKGVFALADNRGYANRGSRQLSQAQEEIVVTLIKWPNKLNIAEIIRAARAVMNERGIECKMADDTIRRWINDWKNEHYDEWVYHREGGSQGLNLKCLPYLMRDWSMVEVGDVLVADGHVLNFDIINPATGKPKRMVWLVWYDMRSNYPVGWEIMPTENTQCIASALRRGLLRVKKQPKVLYLDNGRAFRAKFFQGCDDFRQSGLTGLFERIGGQKKCEVILAWPYHGQSKPVERFYKTFGELERLSPTYVGNNINNKPPRMMRGEKVHKRLWDKIIQGYIPTIEDAHIAIAKWVDDYADRAQRNTHLKGLSPFEVFSAGCGRGIDVEALNFLMLSEKDVLITRNGVKLRIDGEDVYFFNSAMFGKKKRVVVKYDPVALSLCETDSVYVYMDGLFLCEAKRLSKTHPVARVMGGKNDVVELAEQIKTKKSLEKQTVKSAKEFAESEIIEDIKRISGFPVKPFKHDEIINKKGFTHGNKKTNEPLLDEGELEEEVNKILAYEEGFEARRNIDNKAIEEEYKQRLKFIEDYENERLAKWTDTDGYGLAQGEKRTDIEDHDSKVIIDGKISRDVDIKRPLFLKKTERYNWLINHIYNGGKITSEEAEFIKNREASTGVSVNFMKDESHCNMHDFKIAVGF